MSEAGFINYKGKEVLLVDFSNTSEHPAFIKTAGEATALAAPNQPGSLLGLVDLSGVRLDKDKQATIKKMASHNRPYMKFIAIVGLRGLREVILRIMLRLKKRTNHKVMSSRQDALDWLAGL